MNDLKGIIEDCNKSDLVSDKVIKKVIEIIGQEEWQNIHDEKSDICTTTGELIITLKGLVELEKENAELKEKLKPENCLKLLAKEGYVKFTSDQLTKAKELLKKWVELYKPKVGNIPSTPIQTETEQFLAGEK